MKLVLIIQARMNSKRFPGKVLKPILGRPMLEYLIERVKRVNEVNEIALATTENDNDAPVVNLGRRQGITVFQGSEADVLSRFYGAAKLCHADAVIRVTGDCPLIDPKVISKVIRLFQKKSKQVDYVSNVLKRTYPRGMDTEVFSFAALEDAHQSAQFQYDREHVTPFIYKHSDRYRLANVEYSMNLSHHRWTVDTPEDFELIQRIVSAFCPSNPIFTLEDILELIEAHPEWEIFNAHITQKSN